MPAGVYKRKPHRGPYKNSLTRPITKRNCDDHDFIPNKKNPEHCDICSKRYVAKHAKAARFRVAAVVDAWKLTQGCAICEYAEHPAALELDHIIPVTKLGIRTFPKTRKDYTNLIFDPNIQVLCANCHRIKTRDNGEHLLRKSI